MAHLFSSGWPFNLLGLVDKPKCRVQINVPGLCGLQSYLSDCFLTRCALAEIMSTLVKCDIQIRATRRTRSSWMLRGHSPPKCTMVFYMDVCAMQMYVSPRVGWRVWLIEICPSVWSWSRLGTQFPQSPWASWSEIGSRRKQKWQTFPESMTLSPRTSTRISLRLAVSVSCEIVHG